MINKGIELSLLVNVGGNSLKKFYLSLCYASDPMHGRMMIMQSNLCINTIVVAGFGFIL